MSHYYNLNLPLRDYSFDGTNEQPLQVERATAKALRQAWQDLMQAKHDLAEAQENIPSYTGQWDNADYVRNEQQTFIVASNAFEDALVASARASMQL